MATLFRRPNSKYWQCAFFNAAGKRKYVSTGETKKAKALAVAVELEKHARNLDPEGQAEQRAILAVVEEAGADALRGRLSEDRARDHVDRILKLTGAGGTVHSVSVRQWLVDWLEEKRRTTEQGTVKRYEAIILPFLAGLSPEKQNAPLSAVTPEDVRQFRNKQIDEGKSPSTANLTVKTLRIPFNLARRQGILRVNPAESVETLKVRGKSKESFDFDQVQRLLAAALKKETEARTERERCIFQDWRAAILTAYYTGQRQSDVTEMKWGQVNLEQGIIEFRQEKTDTAVTIPIHPKLAAALASMRGQRDTDLPVFSSLSGKISGGNNGLSGMFRRLMDVADIKPETTAASGMGRSRNSLSFHSLRHAFNTQLAESGVSQEIRQLLTGHSSEAVNDRYTHLGLETLRAAVQRLPSVDGDRFTNFS